MQAALKSPGFLAGTLLALLGAAASYIAVDTALASLPDMFRMLLAACMALFPMYAAVRAYTSLAEVELAKWIRGGIAVVILLAGHGGIVVVAARQAGVGPLELLLSAQ